MSKKKVNSETKSVVPEPFNSLLPGPTHKTTNTYSDGSKSEGYGNSKTSSQKAADKKGSSSGGGGGCFLTSACVDYMGLNDNCNELSILRKYRDKYIMTLENGNELLTQYYEESPKIVLAINQSLEKHEIYSGIYKNINEALSCIAKEKYDQAFYIYEDMFLSLKKRLLD